MVFHNDQGDSFQVRTGPRTPGGDNPLLPHDGLMGGLWDDGTSNGEKFQLIKTMSLQLWKFHVNLCQMMVKFLESLILPKNQRLDPPKRRGKLLSFLDGSGISKPLVS